VPIDTAEPGRPSGTVSHLAVQGARRVGGASRRVPRAERRGIGALDRECGDHTDRRQGGDGDGGDDLRASLTRSRRSRMGITLVVGG
jgi:hypothetical protein